jgi:hypothetical protein
MPSVVGSHSGMTPHRGGSGHGGGELKFKHSKAIHPVSERIFSIARPNFECQRESPRGLAVQALASPGSVGNDPTNATAFTHFPQAEALSPAACRPTALSVRGHLQHSSRSCGPMTKNSAHGRFSDRPGNHGRQVLRKPQGWATRRPGWGAGRSSLTGYTAAAADCWRLATNFSSRSANAAVT